MCRPAMMPSMPNAKNKDLTPKFRDAFDERVKFAYLFGSRGRGTHTRRSDIDIAIYLRNDCDYTMAKLEFAGAVMDLLGTDHVDMVILNTAPLPLAARVIRDGEVLAERDPFARHRYESLILREYFDFSRFEFSILKRRFALG